MAVEKFVVIDSAGRKKIYSFDPTSGGSSTPAVGAMSMKPGISGGAPSLRASFDWFVSEGVGKWATATSLGSKTFDANAYPDLLGSGAYSNYQRGRVFRFGSTWGCHPLQAANVAPTFAQTTTDLAAMTNRDVPSAAIDYSIVNSWIDEVNGYYIATIISGYSYVYSTNGTTWNFVPYIYAANATSAPSFLSNPVVFNGTYSFYDSIRARRFYTTDHVNFTQVPTTVLVGGDHGGTVHLVNGLLFIFKNSSTTYYTSNDGGITWVARTWPATAAAANVVSSLAHNGTVYLFTTQAATSNTSIWTSADLVTWNNRTCAFAAAITIARVQAANGVFFAFSSVSQTTFCTSPDGTTWTQRTAASAGLYGMAFYLATAAKYWIVATTRIESSAALATWAAEVTSGPSSLSRTGADCFMLCDTANSKVAYCTSAGVWSGWQSSVWNSILTTAQLGNGILKNHGASGTNWQYVVRVKA